MPKPHNANHRPETPSAVYAIENNPDVNHSPEAFSTVDAANNKPQVKRSPDGLNATSTISEEENKPPPKNRRAQREIHPSIHR